MTIREAILDELRDVYREDGTIHATDIREYGYANPDSEIGKRLKVGDDTTAAHEWRLQEARNIIRIYVRLEEDPKHRGTISLSTDRVNGNGYRNIEDVMRTDDLRTHAYLDALKEYERVGTKFAWLAGFSSKFSGVIAEIAKARADIEAEAARLAEALVREQARQQRERDRRTGDGDSPSPPPP